LEVPDPVHFVRGGNGLVGGRDKEGVGNVKISPFDQGARACQGEFAGVTVSGGAGREGAHPPPGTAATKRALKASA